MDPTRFRLRHLNSESSHDGAAQEERVAARRGAIWMLVAAFSFACMAASAKLIPEVPNTEKVFVRSLISVVLTLLMLHGAGSRAIPKRPWMLMWRAFFGFLGLWAYFEAIDRLPLGTAVTIYNMTPLFAAALGMLFLSERFRTMQILSLLVGLGGVALIKGLSPEVTWVGVGFALCTALASAIAYTLVRVLTRTEHPLTIVMAFAVVSLPLSLLAGWGSWRMPQGMEWVWLFALGITTQSGQVCLTKALQSLRASRATQIGFVGVIFAMLLGIPLGDGIPGMAQLAGAGLIFWSLHLGRQRVTKELSR